MIENYMEYKGYHGSALYSDKDQVFYGKLEGIRDLVSYEGTDVNTLKKNFEEAVDDYLVTCKNETRKPDAPFKGSFNVRISPQTHRKIVIEAKQTGISLNRYISNILEKSVGQ